MTSRVPLLSLVGQLSLVGLAAMGCGPLLGLDEEVRRLEGVGGADVSCKQVGDCDDGNDCTVDSCDLVLGHCQHAAREDGLAPIELQVGGDCKRLACDGGGEIVEADLTDTPAPQNECVAGVCNATLEPSQVPLPAKTSCPGGVCDGQGACVQCLDDGHCQAPTSCGGGGVENQCGCTPATCSALGLTCGDDVPDGCFGTLTCNGGTQDGEESDVDCGGDLAACATRCADGRGCGEGRDCKSAFCAAGTCDKPWSRGFGDEGSQTVRGVASDADANVVIAGTFSGSLSLGGETLVGAPGGSSLFVAKLTATGAHEWSVALGDEGFTEGSSVAVDSAGSVVVSGWVQGKVALPSGPIKSDTPVGFVVKLDSSGAPLWDLALVTSPPSGQMAGSSRVYDVTSGDKNRVLLSGVLSGDCPLPGGAVLSGDAGGDGFVLALDSKGDVLFDVDLSGAGLAIPLAVASGPGGVFAATGTMSGQVDLGGGVLTSQGSSLDAFVVAYDAAGGHLFSKRFGDSAEQIAADVAFDHGGSVVVVGTAHGTIDFGGGALVQSGGGDLFVAKLGATTGQHAWSLLFGDAAPEVAGGVATNARDEIFVVGSFGGSLPFKPSSLFSAGGYDAFAIGLDTGGGALFGVGFGDGQAQYGQRVAVTPYGAVLMAGDFLGSIDFGYGPLFSSGAEDIFVSTITP